MRVATPEPLSWPTTANFSKPRCVMTSTWSLAMARLEGMIRAVRRLAAVAVAAQIGGYHGEPLGQSRRHFVPHDMSLRITMQHQHRRPASAHHGVDGCPAGVHAH